ncbi:ATP-dependent helicase HrpB [Microbacterium amylolyticum]|uniref:ATP-dependent helicase HrpB n=1 Tax=Microbacterium amylolyticum TaxID=936337 RepID=A0ABS4ZEA6_9MICO|nr:ATP-dependent helicase HrpB [Microbacterium amylolyticum]MBP2435594.1 ATP-dependent helicase HrpB [Microbacterium amylolyticum]
MASRPFDIARIGAGLVVARAESELRAAAQTGAMVVTAAPGTGKTTVVPPLVANLVDGRVIVTQPRRVAVRSAARRLAQLSQTEIGGSVGYTVRGESHTSENTRVEVVTPGVLLRRLLNNPSLDGVGAVIVDEVHERSIDGDLLLGMLAEVRELRDDLLAVAMSATLDASAVSDLLRGAAIVDVPSALHPLEIAYTPGPTRIDQWGVSRHFLSHLAAVAVTEHAADGGDALVFVPGAREVDAVVDLIRSRASGVEVLPLHGQLPPAEQDRATAGRTSETEPRRIIVSTSLAESSLTVPGVRLVIDAGLSREPRRDAGRDMTGLVTVSTSRAGAEQRAGRAARQEPGRAVRVYTEAEFAAMRPEATPEITAADLTDAALLLAAWGTPRAEGLRLLTPPPVAAIDRATETLRSLALISDTGHPTPLGARVSRMPAGPREARALLSAAEHDVPARAAGEVVAAISGGYRDAGADLTRVLRELRDGIAAGSARWRADAKRLAQLSSDVAAGTSTDAAGTVTALAFPERIARRVAAGSRTYLFASGTRAAIPESSPLLGTDWIAVAEVQRADGRVAEGTGAVIRLAAPLSEDRAIELGGNLLTVTRESRIIDGALRVREQTRLGAIPLSSTPARATEEDIASAYVAHVQESGLSVLRWSDEATMLRGRLSFLHRNLGEPWPDVSDDALLAHTDDWLLPALRSAGHRPNLSSLPLTQALRSLLPWPAAARFDELAPERLAVPSGSQIRIVYPASDEADARPVVPVKLQEVFGLAHTPRVADGRVPVLFHLLSPARHPLAVTDDLASFWSGPYADVRKQMRGKYPKHPWPEDPWSVPATAKTNRALRRQ